jgi:hypothetical protein
MATNNLGNLLDSSGNVAVDFVWGNFAPQPNDERTDGTAVEKVANNAAQNKSWSGYSVKPSARLDFTLDSHAIQEAGWANYPSFIAATGKFNITQVSGDGTTVRFESYNTLADGDVVTITGCNTFNLSSATVAKATRDYFTVTDSTTGSLININNGIVQLSNALTAADGAFVSGAAYVRVPNVVGLTTALAQDALADAELTVTTASGVTPAISNVVLTSNVATVTTAAAHGFAVGDLVTVAAVTATTINATLAPITAVTSTTFSYAKTATNVVSAADTGTAKVPARFSTIKTQSIAAGAASTAIGAAITITPYAAS